MKIIRAILLTWFLALVTCCAQPAANPGNAPFSTADTLADETVAIVMLNPQAGPDEPAHRTICSGVWVGHSKILTAAHCVVDKSDSLVPQVLYSMRVDSKGPEKEPVAIRGGWVDKFDQAHDLALIHTADSIPLHPVASVAQTDPAYGGDLDFVGHPSGWVWTYTHGWVAGYLDKDFPGPSFGGGDLCPALKSLGLPCEEAHSVGPWMMVSAPIWYGNSGGGAFDSAGRLVGIASFMVRTPSKGFYVARGTITEFLHGT